VLFGSTVYLHSPTLPVSLASDQANRLAHKPILRVTRVARAVTHRVVSGLGTLPGFERAERAGDPYSGFLLLQLLVPPPDAGTDPYRYCNLALSLRVL
jgi:hypothetical protein